MTNQIEYQLFPESYFSGCDVSIYFGDVWVDEIVSMTFSLAEQIQPLYGYNSYVYDDVARGTRIIQGSFRLNFKEANYLQKVIEQCKKSTEDSRKFMTHITKREKFIPNPDIYIDEDISPDQYLAKLMLMDEDEVDRFFNAQRQTAWGSKSIIGDEYSQESFPHFDMSSNGLNIVVVYGPEGIQGSHFSSTIRNVPRAFHKIIGVQITNSSQVISPDGQPVFEDYQFIAKDLN